MDAPIVVAQDLGKWYGPRLAVRGVSFSVEAGEVVGLLGPNGSGKSTIFRILTGYLTPSAGKVSVVGHDAVTASRALRREIGYAPEDAPLYDHMRVAEFLRFMARIKGLDGRNASRAAAAATARLRLEQVLRMPISKLSRGYRQRVALAQALLGEPKLLVLDEPTTGLDPSQVIAFRHLVGELAESCTVLVASHVLSEIERIASRVMILLDGTLLTADALRHRSGTQRLRLDVAAGEEEVRTCLGAVAGVRLIEAEPGSVGETRRYVVTADQGPRIGREIADALAGRGVGIAEFAAIPADLEQIFLDLTRPRAEAAA
jgi:ABC-2 type transport system ATP-binding protein